MKRPFQSFLESIKFRKVADRKLFVPDLIQAIVFPVCISTNDGFYSVIGINVSKSESQVTFKREGNTMKYHYKLLEWPKSKKLTTLNAGEDVEQHELSFIGGRNTKWHNHCGRLFGNFV